MIFSQMSGNANVSKANQIAIQQQTIARDAIDAKASIRGMQVGVRDIRLAGTAADLSKANDYIAVRLKSVHGFADEMLKLSRSTENRERIEKLKGMSRRLCQGRPADCGGAERSDRHQCNAAADGELPAEAVAKVAKLNDETIRIAREVTLPVATELEGLANKIVDYAKHRVEEENAVAAGEMASEEQNFAWSSAWPPGCC